MMNPAISAAAREWVIRTQHPEFEDWDGLGSWMSKDVRHADEFNRLSLLDQDIAEAVAASPPPRGEVVALRPPTRFGWRGWALAASFGGATTKATARPATRATSVANSRRGTPADCGRAVPVRKEDSSI